MAVKMKTLGWLLAGLLSTGAAQAALHDRGGGLLYDDVLDVTWLQDANYAKTSGYDPDGRMLWEHAVTWAAKLAFHDTVRNVDYTDWRLPTVEPVNGTSFNLNYSTDGSTDYGYNITSPNSELAYMYHVNLGLKSYYSSSGAIQADSGVFGNGTFTLPQNDVGPVRNLQSYAYWSGTQLESNWGYAWAFSTGGAQIYYPWFGVSANTELFAWAVRDGDVAAVPEPEGYAMLLAGLGLVAAAARRRRILGAS